MRLWIALGLLVIQLLPFWGVEVKFRANVRMERPFITRDRKVEFRTFVGEVYITEDGRVIYTLPGGDGARIVKILRGAEIEKVVGVGRLEGSGTDEGFEGGGRRFSSVSFGRVYEGIGFGLTLYGGEVGEIFRLEPGADPSKIAVKVEGARKLRVDSSGVLVVEAKDGTVFVFYPPSAYQYFPLDRIRVPVRYRILSKDTYGFKVEGKLVEGLPLVIECFWLFAIREATKNEGK